MRTVMLAIAGWVIGSMLSACAVHSGPRQIDTTTHGGTSAESNWSRVSQLAPATEIVVTTKASQPAARYFVVADDLVLTVMNLTNPALEGRPVRVLLDMAKRPENLVALRKTGTLTQENVRLGHDGLFIADRKVAAFDQLVETITRGEISEIRGPVVARGSVVGTVFGAWLGFCVGVLPALGGASEGVAGLALIGSTTLGGVLGFRGTSHETEGVVYRAP